METASLGTKRTCSSCGARFFDLGKDSANCPRCGVAQERQARRLQSGPHRSTVKRSQPLFSTAATEVDPEIEDAVGTDDSEADEEERDEDDIVDEDDTVSSEEP